MNPPTPSHRPTLTPAPPLNQPEPNNNNNNNTIDTGGVGFKSVFLGCARVLKDQFPNVSIRKTIVAPTEQRGSSKKAGLFEVIVGDETFDNKRGEGVYLPMADIAAAIDRLAQRRDKERRAVEAALAAAAAGQEE